MFINDTSCSHSCALMIRMHIVSCTLTIYLHSIQNWLDFIQFYTKKAVRNGINTSVNYTYTPTKDYCYFNISD